MGSCSIHLGVSSWEMLQISSPEMCLKVSDLTHWGRVTHICVGNLTIIGSDNGLSPGRRQAITWTNVGILLIGPLGTNFSEMLIKIHTFSFKKIHLKMSGKWRAFCLGLNVVRLQPHLNDTVVLWYNWVHYDMILHTAQQLYSWNNGQTFWLP